MPLIEYHPKVETAGYRRWVNTDHIISVHKNATVEYMLMANGRDIPLRSAEELIAAIESKLSCTKPSSCS